MNRFARLANAYRTVRAALNSLEKDPFVRAIVVGAFLLTAWHLVQDIDDRRDERAARQEERVERERGEIARAWEILTTSAAGNSGKAQAIETLFRAGVSLRGIDLSCETMGGGWDLERLTCARPVDLTGMNLASPAAISHELQLFTLDQDYLRPRSIDQAPTPWRTVCLANEDYVQDAHYSTSQYYMFSGLSTGLPGSPLERYRKSNPFHSMRSSMRRGAVDFRYAKLSGVDFSSANLTGADFTGADLRGAVFDQTIAEAALFENTLMQGMEIRFSYLNGAQIAFAPKACAVDDFLSGRAPRECEGDAFQKKILIAGSKADALEIRHHDAFHFQIRNTSMVNAEVEFGVFPSFREFDNAEKGSISDNLATVIFSDVDFTCSIFLNDDNARLSRNNISSVQFPPRHTVEDYETDGAPTVVHTLIDRVGWDDDALFHPWAWTDQPPRGNLGEERVASCDPTGVRFAWNEGKTQGRNPSRCETADDRRLKTDTPLTLHNLPLPPPAVLQQSQILKNAPIVTESEAMYRSR